MGLFKKRNDDLGSSFPDLDQDMPPLHDTTPDTSSSDSFSMPKQPTPPSFDNQPFNTPPSQAFPPPNEPSAMSRPGSDHVDFNNPDLNSVTGSPKPKEQLPTDDFMTSPAKTGPVSSSHVEKDLQIIIAKLDAVKSELDSLHQRVQRIERIAEADQVAREKKQTLPRW